MSREPIRLFVCPACEQGIVAEEVPVVACPACDYQTHYPSAPLFGRKEWEAEQRPAFLAACLGVLGFRPTPRRARLVFTAVARIGFESCKDRWFGEAVSAAEEWADSGRPRLGVDDLLRDGGRRLPGPGTAEWDWHEIAMQGLNAVPRLTLPGPYHGDYSNTTQWVFADAYRELYENPFVTIGWKPDWQTSTVLDLARVIYDRHAFDLMPILADALLDAGCDHQLVQDHCRSSRPHARGC
jgi:hypothetical protein